MAVTVLGAQTFTEQPSEMNKERGHGWVLTRTWKGPQVETNNFLIGEVVPLDPEKIMVTKGQPTTIKAEFPDDVNSGILAGVSNDPLQEAEDEAIWELIPSALDKPLATHPAFAQSGVTPTVIELIEKAIRDGTACKTDWVAAFGVANMNDYRDLRVKGTDSWRAWSWTIRKTISVGEAVEVQAAQIDAQKIVAYNAIGIPATVKWAQPVLQLWDGVNVLPPQAIDEWMACPPQVRYNRKKYDIVKEWIGAWKWYKILYNGGTALSTESGF